MALEVCQRATTENPTCHEARYGVAYYMSKAGYPPELVYPIIRRVSEMQPTIFHYRLATSTVLLRMRENERAYLTIADASRNELQSVTCSCCLARLRRMYVKANDSFRANLCERLALDAHDECGQRSNF
ncbi:MAG: hypothetical protein AAF497_10705 [Planctomycetota bacterium]